MNSINFLLAATLSWVPAKEADMIRRTQIVRDALEAVKVEGRLFTEGTGDVQTALFMLAIASYESGYHVGVDNGRIRGDGGQSWCLMQMRVGAYKGVYGWYGRDLVVDRVKCFRAGLWALHQSLKACKYMKGSDKFSAYAHGKCIKNSRAMKTRYNRAAKWIQEHGDKLEAQ
jgi:hypothetical protein